MCVEQSRVLIDIVYDWLPSCGYWWANWAYMERYSLHVVLLHCNLYSCLATSAVLLLFTAALRYFQLICHFSAIITAALRSSLLHCEPYSCIGIFNNSNTIYTAVSTTAMQSLQPMLQCDLYNQYEVTMTVATPYFPCTCRIIFTVTENHIKR